jgi:poly-gamma-glutamate synthesis protein (capsule biosynthesis protein)
MHWLDGRHHSGASPIRPAVLVSARAVAVAVAVALALALAVSVAACGAAEVGPGDSPAGAEFEGAIAAEVAGSSTTVGSPSTATASTATASGATASSAAAPNTTRSSPATQAPRRRLVISGIGDTNLDAGYIPALAVNGFDHAFSGIGTVFADDDLTVANLECAAAATGAPVKQRFNFNCGPEPLPAIRRAGVDVVNLANNHAADYGPDALIESRANVIAAGLLAVGAGADIDEAYQPAVVEIGGWRIAVLGFNAVLTSGSWLAGPDHPGMADGTNTATMVEAVKAADAIADLVIVTVHWGWERDLEPRGPEIDRGHAMIDAGADIIFGHHPHRLQPLDVYNGRPIAWSLGNFVWPRFSVLGARSAIAQVTVEPDGSFDACLIPVDIVSHGHPVIQPPGAMDMPGPVCDPGRNGSRSGG